MEKKTFGLRWRRECSKEKCVRIVYTEPGGRACANNLMIECRFTVCQMAKQLKTYRRRKLREVCEAVF